MNFSRRLFSLIYFFFSFKIIFAQINDSTSNIDKTKQFILNTQINSKKDNYLFVYSNQYDMCGNAQNSFSVSRLFGRGLDEITCRTDKISGITYSFKKKNFLGRLFVDFVPNLLFNNWLSTVQHEYMGHGFRAREFNASINGYVLNPGILGNAYIDFHEEDLPYYGRLLESVGGSESNLIFAREAFRQSLSDDYFYHYYLFSFIMKIDLDMYILGSTPDVGSYEWYYGGWDVATFIQTFKNKSNDSEQQIYNMAKKGAYWSLFDPSLLISLFNYVQDYAIRGKIKVKNPMIKIKNLSFLPFTDFHLSPFGFEYYIGSYLKYEKTLYETYYRWSNGNIDGKSYGCGMVVINAFRYNHFRFDAGFDFWKQDFNLLYYEIDTDKYQDKIFSGKIYLKTFYQINNPLSLYGQISYKGDGFLLGNPIKKGINAKIGMGFNF